MGKADKWLKKEIEYLDENWGKVSLLRLSTKLKRTKIGIYVKAKRLKLGASTRADEYITANQVSEMINVDRHAILGWIKSHNLKAIKKKTLFVKIFWLINLNDFLDWLKKNQDKFDSKKIELFALGSEPRWLKDKRLKDRTIPTNNYKKWTYIEEQRLMLYLKEMPYKKIAKILGRSYNSIDRKIFRIRKKIF